MPSPELPYRPGAGCDVYKRRILVIDDEVSLTKLVAILLERTDTYVVRVENNAAKALAAAEEFHPDLVLLDIAMPVLDGGELASRIRANPILQDVRIVFLTGTVTEDEVAEHRGYIGGQRFLAKPFRAGELIEVILQQLAA